MNVIQQIIDQPTTELMAELQEDFDISFEPWDMSYNEVFTQNKKAVINYNPKAIKTETIAHELLHLWLKKFNYFSSNHIYLSFQNDEKLSKVFTKFLCDFIGNYMDHYKMYPKYLSMGYKPEYFIQEGLNSKCSLSQINFFFLKTFGVYNSKSVNLYIGCLFSIYADHVENDYAKHLTKLKKKDSELFNIVTNFWNSWKKFDIKNIDPINNSDYELIENFIFDIREWASDKKIR
jgi:hypothetical protein